MPKAKKKAAEETQKIAIEVAEIVETPKEATVRDLIDWERPSGSLITTNSEKATIAHAESQSWKRK